MQAVRHCDGADLLEVVRDSRGGSIEGRHAVGGVIEILIPPSGHRDAPRSEMIRKQ